MEVKFFYIFAAAVILATGTDARAQYIHGDTAVDGPFASAGTPAVVTPGTAGSFSSASALAATSSFASAGTQTATSSFASAQASNANASASPSSAASYRGQGRGLVDTGRTLLFNGAGVVLTGLAVFAQGQLFWENDPECPQMPMYPFTR